MTDAPRGYARSRAKNDAVRAQLKPLAARERPRPILAAATIAALLAITNLVLILAGWHPHGYRLNDAQSMGFVAAFTILAVLIFTLNYWAVLAFQALLGCTIVIAGLSLLIASNLNALLLSVVLIAGGTTLFWLLIRPLARIQMKTVTRQSDDAIPLESAAPTPDKV